MSGITGAKPVQFAQKSNICAVCILSHATCTQQFEECQEFRREESDRSAVVEGNIYSKGGVR